jgi:diacylglycerol kinase (ATP)
VKKVMLIYNPMSGKQNFENKLDYVMKTLQDKFDDVFVYRTDHPNHATELSITACKENFDMLIIVGGDGTFNECVNGLMDFKVKPKIGYIPAGTCCDIGLSLGLSKNVNKALDIMFSGTEVKMDVVRTNERYSCYVTGTGAFIDISYVTDSKLKKRIGYLAYFFKALEEIFTIPHMRMRVYHDGVIDKGVYTLMLIINSKRVAGINMIYKPSLDDGLVNVVLYKNVYPFNFLIYALSFIFPFWSTPLVKRFKTDKLEVRTTSKSSWNIDGEYAGRGNQIIEVNKQAIKVVVPEKVKRKYFRNQL